MGHYAYSINHSPLGVPTFQAGIWKAIFTQAFDLG